MKKWIIYLLLKTVKKEVHLMEIQVKILVQKTVRKWMRMNVKIEGVNVLMI